MFGATVAAAEEQTCDSESHSGLTRKKRRTLTFVLCSSLRHATRHLFCLDAVFPTHTGSAAAADADCMSLSGEAAHGGRTALSRQG